MFIYLGCSDKTCILREAPEVIDVDWKISETDKYGIGADRNPL